MAATKHVHDNDDSAAAMMLIHGGYDPLVTIMTALSSNLGLI